MSDAILPAFSDRGSLVRHAIAALVVIAGGAGGLVYWAASTEIAGAVVANGTLVVESHPKLVQHQDGGTVKTVLVQDDEPVSAGQVLLMLEDTAIKATLEAAKSQLAEATIEVARLNAEVAGNLEFTVPADVARDLQLTDMVATQRQILASELADRDFQIAQLDAQVGELGNEADGLVVQQQANRRQLEILTKRAAAVDSLLASQLAQADEASTLHLQEAAAQGEEGRLTAAIAQTRATAAEKLLAAKQVQTTFMSARLDDLKKARRALSEALQQQRVAQDQLDRTIVRAPESGIVHELVAHTVGGVVAPGETIMKIVPQTDDLLVAIQISPSDIDQVRLGQTVTLRFTGFERRRMPEASGEVAQISPDLLTDPQTGRAYYSANVRIAKAASALPADFHLLPGMPVEAFLTTGDRTVLSYLVHPFVEELQLAFREQ